MTITTCLREVEDLAKAGSVSVPSAVGLSGIVATMFAAKELILRLRAVRSL